MFLSSYTELYVRAEYTPDRWFYRRNNRMRSRESRSHRRLAYIIQENLLCTFTAKGVVGRNNGEKLKVYVPSTQRTCRDLTVLSVRRKSTPPPRLQYHPPTLVRELTDVQRRDVRRIIDIDNIHGGFIYICTFRNNTITLMCPLPFFFSLLLETVRGLKLPPTH